MMSVEELRNILETDLNIGVPGSADLGDKIGLLSMICYLTNALKAKKPSVTHYDVIKLCTKDDFPDERTNQVLALMCEWFANGCLTFPNLGIQPKDMPVLIKEKIRDLCPF